MEPDGVGGVGEAKGVLLSFDGLEERDALGDDGGQIGFILWVRHRRRWVRLCFAGH